MREILNLSGFFLLVFLVSAGISSFIVRLRSPRKHFNLPPNSRLRFSSGSGMYRSRVLRDTSDGIEVEAPIQRDHYVPIRIGEALVVEATCPGGVIHFRSKVMSRSQEDHSLVMERPSAFYKTERRQESRMDGAGLEGVCLEGKLTQVLDVSTLGVRLVSPVHVDRGERVRVDFPWLGTPVFGYVLDALGREARVRFEERIPLPH